MATNKVSKAAQEMQKIKKPKKKVKTEFINSIEEAMKVVNRMKKDEVAFWARRTSSWTVLHRWLDKETSKRDILFAMVFEVRSKKRYPIIKRLHQRWHTLAKKDDLDYLEKVIADLS